MMGLHRKGQCADLAATFLLSLARPAFGRFLDLFLSIAVAPCKAWQPMGHFSCILNSGGRQS